jgi:hypothetical protein
MKSFTWIFTIIILCAPLNVIGQDFSVAVSYLHGEKSKDSHSSQESIAIGGTSVAYSVKYSGRRGKNDIDMDKVCEFTEQDIKNIKETIIKKELNVNDSLIDENYKSKSYEVYTNISIAIVMDGQEYKIKINGDVQQLDESKLYKNAVFFITLLRKMSKDC